MSGTCQGTINITIPCTPNWTGGAWGTCQSNGTQTRTETDGCGNTRTATQSCTYVPPYREALLKSCSLNKTSAIPGEGFLIGVTFETGTNTENYKLVLTGDLTGESPQYTLSGSPLAFSTLMSFGITIPTTISGGVKNFTATLVKV